RAALAGREPQRRSFPRSRLATARDDQLQHRLSSVVADRLRDERLRRVRVDAADADLPVRLDRPDELRQLVDPRARSHRQRLLSNDRRDLDQVPPRASSTASSGDEARAMPSTGRPGSRMTTLRPSLDAKPISAIVPQLPPTAM